MRDRAQPSFKPNDAARLEELHRTQARVEERLHRAGSRKASADDLSAEILRAGCSAVSDELAEMVVRCKEQGAVPAQDKGGRVADLFKGRGGKAICDNSRGLFIAAQIGEVPPGSLLSEVVSLYEKSQPACQLGGRMFRSAPMGILISRLVSEHAVLCWWCVATTLVDLIKGYDLAPREAMVGVPDDAIAHGEPLRQHLRDAGLQETAVQKVAECVGKHGSALAKMGVAAESRRLFSELFTNTWGMYGKPDRLAVERLSCGRVTRATRRSRQGCPTGGLLFNAYAAEPLQDIHEEVAARALAVEMQRPSGGALWIQYPVDSATWT